MHQKQSSILFINRTYPPVNGATGRMLSDLARSFAKLGWKVTIVTTGENTSVQQEHDINVIRVKANTTPRSHVEYGLILAKLALKARAQKPHDIVVSMTDPPMSILAGDWVAKKHKAAHIHWCQDLYPDVLPALGISIKDSLLKRLQRASLKAMTRCERIIVIGRCMAKRLSGQGIAPHNMTFIPNWHDAELADLAKDKEGKPSPFQEACSLRAAAKARQEAADKKGISKPHDQQIKAPPKFRILYAGNIGLGHPMDTVLEAAEKLQKTHPAIEFAFAGHSQGHERIDQERIRKGLENIRFIPHQPAKALPALMQSGDIHLISLADKAAGCMVPCKLYSAFAAQRPTIFIGPSASETAKMIKDFEAGDCITQGDTDALINVITRYFEDETHWHTRQQGAIKASEVALPSNSIKAWIKRAAQISNTKRSEH